MIRCVPPYDHQGASHLFSSVVGDAQSILKCAGRTVRLLEEQFIVDDSPSITRRRIRRFAIYCAVLRSRPLLQHAILLLLLRRNASSCSCSVTSVNFPKTYAATRSHSRMQLRQDRCFRR